MITFVEGIEAYDKKVKDIKESEQVLSIQTNVLDDREITYILTRDLAYIITYEYTEKVLNSKVINLTSIGVINKMAMNL